MRLRRNRFRERKTENFHFGPQTENRLLFSPINKSSESILPVVRHRYLHLPTMEEGGAGRAKQFFTLPTFTEQSGVYRPRVEKQNRLPSWMRQSIRPTVGLIFCPTKGISFIWRSIIPVEIRRTPASMSRVWMVGRQNCCCIPMLRPFILLVIYCITGTEACWR